MSGPDFLTASAFKDFMRSYFQILKFCEAPNILEPYIAVQETHVVNSLKWKRSACNEPYPS